MKRTNVILDEKLLEEARRESGERTYSAVINKALQEYVRVETLKRGIDALRAMGGAGIMPGYLEEIRPNAFKTSKRSAANELRAPRKKKSGRGSR